MFILAVGLLARAAIGPAERLVTMVGQQRICALAYAAAFAVNLAGCVALAGPYGGIGRRDRDVGGLRRGIGAAVLDRQAQARPAPVRLAAARATSRRLSQLGSLAAQRSGQRAHLREGVPDHRRLLDPALQRRAPPAADRRPGAARRRDGDVVEQLELGVAPVALVALVADGEIERVAAAADRVAHQLVQMRGARPEFGHLARRCSSPAHDSSSRGTSARD